MEPRTVLPQASFRDSLAVLALLLSLPPALSALALGVYLFFVSMGNHYFTSVLSRLLRGYTVVDERSLVTTRDQEKHGRDDKKDKEKEKDDKDKDKDKDNERSTSSLLILIALFDICVCAALHFTGPWITRGVFVLAKALLAASITGERMLNALLAVTIVALTEFLFSAFVEYIDIRLGVRISQNTQLFPHMLPHSSFNHNFDHYYSFGFDQLSRIINWANLLLAVHVVLVAFASVFRTNFLSKSLNSLTSNNDIVPTFNHLRVKDHTQSETRVAKVELSQEEANTKLDLGYDAHPNDLNSADLSKHIVESDNSLHAVSSSNVVSENFEVFCAAPSKTKQRQPLWSLFAAFRAMGARADIFSGEHSTDDETTALVLSDYAKPYDDFLLSNYEATGILEDPIRIFIDYIGETLVSFQLQNCKEGTVMIRVNHVVWLQVSTGTYGGDTFFIVGGLTPLSQYDIQFLIEREDAEGNKHQHILDDLIVSTVDNKGATVPASPNTGPNREVSSPLVTLQESLITTIDNLVKERLKLKKQRKEMVRKHGSMKSEIELLKNKIASSDRNDEKNYKKVLSLRVSLQQAEDDVARVEQESAELDSHLNELSEVHLVEKRRFDQFARSHQQDKNDYLSRIESKRTKLSDLNVELDSLQSKIEKLTTKQAKLKSDIDKVSKDIETLLKANLDARLKAREERAGKREGLLREFVAEIHRLETEVVRMARENESLKGARSS